MMMIAALSCLIGLSLGLLGGGGSILAVPVLVYGAGLPIKVAIATSLLVVGVTAVFALIPHARRGHVNWKVGALFSVTAMTGAYLGGLAAKWFEGETLLILFAIMMILTGVAMLVKREPANRDSARPMSVTLIIAEGIAVGGITGLVGAGGGFLVVPALVLIGGMNMHAAIGTSLMVIALKSFAAFAGHTVHVSVDYKLALVVMVCAVAGSIAGGFVAQRLQAKNLRSAFGVFVLMMAMFVIWREAGMIVALVSAVFTVLVCLKILSKKAPAMGQSTA
jgi:uncharacterized protein